MAAQSTDESSAIGHVPRHITTRMKYYDTMMMPTNATYYNATASGLNHFCINDVKSGPEQWQRIGPSIRIWQIELRSMIILTNASEGSITPNQLRTLIVYDKATNTAWPDITDILASNASGSAAGLTMYEKNWDNKARFDILMDVTWTTPDESNTAMSAAVYSVLDMRRESFINRIIETPGLLTEYIAQTIMPPAEGGVLGDITDITSGALSIWYISGNDHYVWRAQTVCRIVYEDSS